MRNRLENFDKDRDRGNPNKARELFNVLWPNQAVRIACAKRFARSIRYAHAQADASWEVSMFEWGIRLNVGQVLVLQFDSDTVTAYARSSRGKSEYAAVPVPSRTFEFSPSKIAAVASKDWRDHERFIGAAAEAKKGSPWRKSFSEGAVRYVESILHTKLPRPSYLVSSIESPRVTKSVEVRKPQVHILQGGIENGDKKWLESAATRKRRSPSWIAPKSAHIGDEAVIYITGQGFFATAYINSEPKRRTNWHRRYGAALNRIKLVVPPISLGAIRASIPELKWAKYPRSITTLTPQLGDQVAKVIERRRKTGIPEIGDNELLAANLPELRRLALLSARSSAKIVRRMGTYRERSKRIHYYVLRRAQGHCEGCDLVAPFQTPNREPYLEPHHTRRLADDGPDHPATVIALCPNCHRRAHSAADKVVFNRSLVKRLARLESKAK